MNAQRQSPFPHQGLRFGLGTEALLAHYRAEHPEARQSEESRREALERLAADGHLSAQIASLLHPVDPWRWGLISWASLVAPAPLGLVYLVRRYQLGAYIGTLGQTEEQRHELLLTELRQLLVRILYKQLN